MREKKGAYGVVYQDVMRNKDIPLEAKGIYAYLASLSNAKNECYPTVELICHELRISKDRYYKYMHILDDAGVIKKIQKKTKEGYFSRNVYKLTHEICILENPSMENPSMENPSTENPSMENPSTEYQGTNNNNINNNNINNNSASPDAPKESNAEIESFFESIWKLYPNKKGKAAVSKTKKKELFKVGYDEMSRAINRYVTDLKAEEWRKPQYGSSFFNKGYVDYLDKNYTAAVASDPEKGDRSIYKHDYEELKRELGID